MKSRDYTLTSVDDYISKAPKEVQPKLNEVRSIILSAIPNIEEGISWGQPYYRKDGMLAGFDFYKNNIRFGFGPSLDTTLRQELEAKGYETGGKTIKVRIDQRVPSAYIKKIVKAQAKLNAAKRQSRSNTKA